MLVVDTPLQDVTFFGSQMLLIVYKRQEKNPPAHLTLHSLHIPRLNFCANYQILPNIARRNTVMHNSEASEGCIYECVLQLPIMGLPFAEG